VGIRGLMGAGCVMAALVIAAPAGAAVCAAGGARNGTSSSLPDCRAYEMVSPANGEDGEVYIPRTAKFEPTAIATFLPFQASEDGDSITYLGAPSPEGNGSIGDGGGNQYLAHRAATGGWSTTDIQPAGYKTPFFQAFSADLGVSVLDSEDLEPLPATAGPIGGYSVPYLRDDATGAYTPLFKVIPPNRPAAGEASNPEAFGTAHPAEVPEATLFAGGNSGAPGVSPFSHLLYEANDSLTEGAPDPGAEGNDLYEWSVGTPRLVNVLPAESGEPANANASFGAPRAQPREAPDLSHVISADGGKIFWTDLDDGQIYVRVDGTSTLAVSAGSATYWTASDDGRYAYYTEGEELWRYDTDTAQREALAGPGSHVEGVVGVNEEGPDGAYLYFVASGKLTEDAIEGRPNLYLREGEAVRLVATLNGGSSGDDDNGAGGSELTTGDWRPSLRGRTAQITPDGREITFMSRASLTGYPNEGMSEVYLYESGGEDLRCISCAANGTPPSVVEASESQNAATLPISNNATLAERTITSNGGRVLFDSIEPLVASDNNRLQDVYEWERGGEGSCETPSGCVYLLSGGASADISALVAVSSSGNDAFIATRAQLSSLDMNEFFDLYDARVDGISQSAPATCGTGCERASVSPTSFAAPATSTFSGIPEAIFVPVPLSVKTKKLPTTAQKLAKAMKGCHSVRNRHKRVSCERAARKRFKPAAKKAKQSPVYRSGR
jgi:hypothetical protein